MKFNFFLPLWLCCALLTSSAYAQCDFSMIKASIVPSCNGDTNGSIALTGIDNINTSQLSFMDCNAGTLVSGTTIVVNSGEIKRIGTTAWANITINGGTLIVCGSVSILNLKISNEGVLANNGSLSVNCSVTIPDGSAIINNNGSVAFYNPVSVSGTLFNLYGSMATYSTLTINSGGEVLNNSIFSNAALGTTLPDNFDENAAKSCFVEWTGTNKTGNIITGLSAGNYTATIKCGACSITKQYNVAVKSSPSISISSSNNTDALNCNGSFTAIAIGGKAPYYYLCSDTSKKVVVFSNSSNTLCAGKYTVTAVDYDGCGTNKLFDILNNITPVASAIPNVSGSSIVTNGGENNNLNAPVPFVPEGNPAEIQPDQLNEIMRKSGEHQLWDLSAIEISKFAPIEMPDPLLHSSISPAILFSDFPTPIGSVTENNFQKSEMNINGIVLSKVGEYFVESDASGDIQTNSGNNSNTKRICVREKCKYYTSSSTEEIVDTVIVNINSYYWFSPSNTITPIFIYREKTKIFGGIHSAYYQEIEQNPANNIFDLNVFKEQVNLNVTPNPTSGGNVVISYNLPFAASVGITFSGSSSGLKDVIQNNYQDLGQHSFSYNIDDKLSGAYTIALTVDGIPLSKTLVINR